MSQNTPQLPPGLGINPWGLFALIELCFVISFYQVFGHLPWNMGTLGLLMFGLLSLCNLLAMLTVMNSSGTPNEDGLDVDELQPGEQFDDWDMGIDWDDIEIEDDNR